MSKYLDFDGVKYLWSKIKKIIDPLDERITDIEENVSSIQAVIDNVAPQNLLINGDFKIWQRGETFTIKGDEAFHYTADMWCVYASTGQTIKVDKTTDGLQFSGATVIMQRMNPLEVGKNYIFLCKIDGDVKTLPIVGGTYIENSFLRYNKSGSYEQFQIKSNGITNIANARLWEGNTIYKLIKEDKIIALMRCKYEVLNLNNGDSYTVCQYANGTDAKFVVWNTFRETPSIVDYGMQYFNSNLQWVDCEKPPIVVNHGNYLELNITCQNVDYGSVLIRRLPLLTCEPL